MPAELKPANDPIGRTHGPSGKYKTFKTCLRWEFGFTCSLCLCHEADLVEHGAQGTGLFSVEHRKPRSTGIGIDDYANCLLACRYCNGTRGKRATVQVTGEKLLDPTCVAWSAHFTLSNDHLVAIPGDADAEYTAKAYGLNTPRRVIMRRARREQLSGALQALARRAEIGRLLAEHASREEVLQAQALSQYVRSAEKVIARFKMIPVDAPDSCPCNPSITCSLPPFMREQGVSS